MDCMVYCDECFSLRLPACLCACSVCRLRPMGVHVRLSLDSLPTSPLLPQPTVPPKEGAPKAGVDAAVAPNAPPNAGALAGAPNAPPPPNAGADAAPKPGVRVWRVYRLQQQRWALVLAAQGQQQRTCMCVRACPCADACMHAHLMLRAHPHTAAQHKHIHACMRVCAPEPNPPNIGSAALVYSLVYSLCCRRRTPTPLAQGAHQTQQLCTLLIGIGHLDAPWCPASA